MHKDKYRNYHTYIIHKVEHTYQSDYQIYMIIKSHQINSTINIQSVNHCFYSL